MFTAIAILVVAVVLANGERLNAKRRAADEASRLASVAKTIAENAKRCR